MQFIDEAKIYIKSGNGGPGCLSFRREANVPKGGPDGGNGGKGGDIIARCIEDTNTLIDFRYQQHFKAKSGDGGKGKQCHGKNADTLYIDLPLGTEICSDDQQHVLCDMDYIGKEITLAQGGDGGFGNMHFKSSTNQAPRKATKGKEGQSYWIRLKLKLLSDVGLVGLPNAGKSTFLSCVSRARPKIADYPFTTLAPKLGVAYIDQHEFVIADIPGLIEGAHQGVGLGTRFLKHIERCHMIMHIIDATQDDIIGQYKTIRHELVKYSDKLSVKQEVLVLNKCDALDEESIQAYLKQCQDELSIRAIPISAATGQGKETILRHLWAQINPQQDED